VSYVCSECLVEANEKVFESLTASGSWKDGAVSAIPEESFLERSFLGCSDEN
jgi:hypothetical protein